MFCDLRKISSRLTSVEKFHQALYVLCDLHNGTFVFSTWDDLSERVTIIITFENQVMKLSLRPYGNIDRVSAI